MQNLQNIYNKDFYNTQAQESYQSANEVIKYICEILPQNQRLESIIDVGCGVGTWLRAWKENNPSLKIFGIDGNEVYDQLYIPKDSYKQVDLTRNANDLFKEILQDIVKNKELCNLTTMGGGEVSLLI